MNEKKGMKKLCLNIIGDLMKPLGQAIHELRLEIELVKNQLLDKVLESHSAVEKVTEVFTKFIESDNKTNKASSDLEERVNKIEESIESLKSDILNMKRGW